MITILNKSLNTSFYGAKPYKYKPKKANSPLRQSIESKYGKKFIELSELAENLGFSQREYELRRIHLEKLKEKELQEIRNIGRKR